MSSNVSSQHSSKIGGMNPTSNSNAPPGYYVPINNNNNNNNNISNNNINSNNSNNNNSSNNNNYQQQYPNTLMNNSNISQPQQHVLQYNHQQSAPQPYLQQHQQIHPQQMQNQQMHQQQVRQPPQPMPPAREYMQEVRQFDDIKERTEIDNLATIYGFIRATEVLESIYQKDACKEQEYLTSCNRLINSFKSSLLGKYDAEQFFVEYNLKSDCPRAYHRLVQAGVPQAAVQSTFSSERKIIAETTDSYITAMDALKLGQTAKDTVQPCVQGILSCLVKIPGLPVDFAGKIKIKQWLDKLDRMNAHDELLEDEARQLVFDIEASYSLFHEFLEK